jgi:hypothetical protein
MWFMTAIVVRRMITSNSSPKPIPSLQIGYRPQNDEGRPQDVS